MPITKCALISPFYLILILHSLSIYFFTRGFLLSRTELSSFSQCSDLFKSPCIISSPSTHEDSTAGGCPPNADDNSQCWTRPAVDRLIIIIIDALRFDFVAPSSFFEEKMAWMDKLEVLQKLAAEEGLSARIFKAIADPPTTSLQRLKGLTTGGLPTFIDVGNSFGAPAIVEDNLMFQLANNGKRVLMMGDDTWVQLFPHHFNESYPYPSFNVKDLDTVDNGVMEHLLPSLFNDDWDVLIAHFLGVDHAGHIFGVGSTPMIAKLEQYNTILEEVVQSLKNQCGPGGLHENTLLVVMGDHGQTLNGDHGGGTAEEVETALFAMTMRNPATPSKTILGTDYCHPDLVCADKMSKDFPEVTREVDILINRYSIVHTSDGKEMCIGTFQQLDFAVTMASILGIPFPFGSIGRINMELYALAGSLWKAPNKFTIKGGTHSNLDSWMLNYVNNLCINSWQVKRYIDSYSTTSVIGLPSEDLRYINALYDEAQGSWLNIKIRDFSSENGSLMGLNYSTTSDFQKQVDAYSRFLEVVADLARSAWTEFNLSSMFFGLCMMLVSLFFHIFAIRSVHALCESCYQSSSCSIATFRTLTVIFLVAIRAVSFLSNSFILAEGRVANFLLGTSAFLNLWLSLDSCTVSAEDFLFLLLTIIIRFGIGSGISKDIGSGSSPFQFLRIIGIQEWPLLMGLLEFLPVIALSVLVFLLYIHASRSTCWKCLKYIFILGYILSCVLMSVHWFLESTMIAASEAVKNFGKTFAPRIVYAIGLLLFALLALLVTTKKHDMVSSSNSRDSLAIVTTCMVFTWSPTILILLGRQGPYAALVCVLGVWCIARLKRAGRVDAERETLTELIYDPTQVLQWSLLAVCLFFYTGHWCAFDGLRYAAAFIGFEHFNIIRQGILLVIDTFGVSHIIPILTLPFIVLSKHKIPQKKQADDLLYINLTQVFLLYGLITAVTTTLTIICVTIQRRHLMVWGLFAPKYVFDVLGLLLTDVFICVCSLFYYSPW